MPIEMSFTILLAFVTSIFSFFSWDRMSIFDLRILQLVNQPLLDLPVLIRAWISLLRFIPKVPYLVILAFREII